MTNRHCWSSTAQLFHLPFPYVGLFLHDNNYWIQSVNFLSKCKTRNSTFLRAWIEWTKIRQIIEYLQCSLACVTSDDLQNPVYFLSSGSSTRPSKWKMYDSPVTIHLLWCTTSWWNFPARPYNYLRTTRNVNLPGPSLEWGDLFPNWPRR